MRDQELFITYLEEEKKKCIEREQHLIKDERKDEATVCKIESNIYDIFCALYQAAVREAEKNDGDDVMVDEIFLSKAKVVPENWKKSLVAAKKHDDITKILIEEAKLQVAEKIVEEYRRQMEN